MRSAMKRHTPILLALLSLSLVSLVGATAASADPLAPGATDPFVLIPGVWDWANQAGSCQDNPQTLTLSADRTKVTLEYKKPVTNPAGKPQKSEVYKILDARARWLHAHVEGETKKDHAGNAVDYDFVFASSNSFCFHRSDWAKGQCTKMLVRCSAKHP
jgi:hypothetical protein